MSRIRRNYYLGVGESVGKIHRCRSRSLSMAPAQIRASSMAYYHGPAGAHPAHIAFITRETVIKRIGVAWLRMKSPKKILNARYVYCWHYDELMLAATVPDD